MMSSVNINIDIDINRIAVDKLGSILLSFGHQVISNDSTNDSFVCDFFCDANPVSSKDFELILGQMPHYCTLTSVSGLHLDKPAQRIHGRAFQSQEELDYFNKAEAELEEFDHRIVGSRRLQLFKIDPETALGMITWLPNGVILLEKVKSVIRNIMSKHGYNEVITPVLANLDLWKKSGHWDMFRENMFCVHTGSEESTYALKPMNCPFHVSIFKGLNLSYKDLPYKISEFGSCTRYESSGALHGLFRARCFTQDDAHVFCTEDDIYSVVENFSNMLKIIYTKFGFNNIKVFLSTRPEKFAGESGTWDRAERALADAASTGNLSPEINPGDGAFYGPKLDFHIEDIHGRRWQCGTIQLDFVLPRRLEATYIDNTGTKVVPVMIHHAVLGSLERFIGVLLEHTRGWLPLWLSPLPIVIIPVHQDQVSYAEEVAKIMKIRNLESNIDSRIETMAYKIRYWTEKKVPLLLIVGKKEVTSKQVSARINGEEVKEMLSIDDLLQKLKEMDVTFE